MGCESSPRSPYIRIATEKQADFQTVCAKVLCMKILIIDDSKTARKHVCQTLRQSGHDVNCIEAATGRDALEIIRTETFDCMFVDFILPDINGLDLLKEIYDPETELGPAPIIMLTGHGSETTMLEVIHYGAQDYLLKDNISTDSLSFSMLKAQEMYALKKKHNQTEKQLLQAQKMEVIGQLTGGIAHDFNNILTIIFGNTRLLATMLGQQKADIAACLDKVEILQKAAQRGSNLVRRLMVLSKYDALEPVTTHLGHLFDDIEPLLERSLGEAIHMHITSSHDVWPVDIDQAQFEHAIINMCINARDAMPDGGNLTIDMRNITIDSAHISQDSLLKPEANYVVISIADTGLGMDETTRAHIFDPFFTTKETGEGTGLGLSMVYSFIKKSGGCINVESQQGHGTVFRIYIPQSQQNEKQIEATHHETGSRPQSGTETVLVVEDEPEILALSTGLLKSCGYHVLEAKNGEEAMHIITDSNSKIDLLFTDIIMPGDMSGIQLAARTLAIKPDIKILFTTGYTKESIPDYGLISDEYHIINKPYELDSLTAKIRNVLEEQL